LAGCNRASGLHWASWSASFVRSLLGGRTVAGDSGGGSGGAALAFAPATRSPLAHRPHLAGARGPLELLPALECLARANLALALTRSQLQRAIATRNSAA